MDFYCEDVFHSPGQFSCHIQKLIYSINTGSAFGFCVRNIIDSITAKFTFIWYYGAGTKNRGVLLNEYWLLAEDLFNGLL